MGIFLQPMFYFFRFSSVWRFAIAFGAGLWYRGFDGQISRFSVHRPVYRPVRTLQLLALAFTDVVPAQWRLLYSLNPLVGVIDGFRWAILGGEHTIYLPGFVLSLGLLAVLVGTGMWYLRKTERDVCGCHLSEARPVKGWQCERPRRQRI